MATIVRQFIFRFIYSTMAPLNNNYEYTYTCIYTYVCIFKYACVSKYTISNYLMHYGLG